MKNKVLFFALSTILGLAIGYLLGGVGGNNTDFRIPPDVVNNFGNCTSECDRLDRQAMEVYDECTRRLNEELEVILQGCGGHIPIPPDCLEKLQQWKLDKRACENAYSRGLEEVRQCRTKCNNLISKSED